MPTMYGSYLFPDAVLIARTVPADVEEHAFTLRAKEHTPELRECRFVCPNPVFNEGMLVRLGGKTIHIYITPGPSPEVRSVHVREERCCSPATPMMPLKSW